MISNTPRTWVFWASAVLCLAGPALTQPPAPVPAGPPQPVIAPPPAAPPTPVALPSVPIHSEPTLPCDPLPNVETCEQSFGYFVEGDFLYVKPRRRLQDFAIVDPFNDGTVAGPIKSLDWDWRSAFRIGGGLRLSCGLEAAFYYTYLHDATHGSATAPDGGVLFATLTHPGTVDQVATAFADTSFNYNVFDFELARSFKPAEAFGLRLFVGSRSTRIDQNFNAVYDGITANRDFVTTRVNFNGTGARIGGEGTWHPGYGLGLYGRAAASLVLGDFKTRLAEINNAGATVLVNVTDCFDKVVPVLELGFGITYETHGCRLTLGYEYTNWFGLADLPDFGDDVHQGKLVRRISDLSIDGLVVRAEWRY